jgi:hypothetical protein
MSFTTAEVNGWFQTIDGLPPTTAPIPSGTSSLYVSELNAGTATPLQIQANLENFPFNTNPPPTNVITATFYRTTVADFVIREFQAAWGVVPNSTQYEAWVARVIANPSLEHGGMSQALAGTPQFMAEYNTTSPTQPATVGFINQLAHNLGITPGSGAYNNVGLPVWQVLQNFVSSQAAVNDMAAATANFQNLLLAGQTPSGNIFLLPSGTPQSLTLTTGVDTPTTGFTSGHGATATAAGSVFVAGPAGNAPLGVTNTLNVGDDLETSGAAIGATKLSYTAVNNPLGLANPPLVAGLTMNGVNEADILNTTTHVAGFSGNITGLTIATLAAGSIGGVLLGVADAGLNTALATVNINAGDGDEGFEAWITQAAFQAAITAGTDAVNVFLGGQGGVATTVTLNDTTVGATSTIGYNKITVNSGGGGPNTLELNTNATTTSEIDVTGGQNLHIFSHQVAGVGALNIANLHTFNGGTATGNLDVWFFGRGTGKIAVTGGSGNNDFVFATANGGGSNFTAGDSINGGVGGTNALVLEVETGAILLPGVGPNITNIQTIEQISNDVGPGHTTALTTADMSLAGSATTLALNANYHNGGVHESVTVTNLTNADTVTYGGTGPDGVSTGQDLGTLTLSHATPIGLLSVINFTMDSTSSPADLTVDHLVVAPTSPALAALNVDSTGDAGTNVIFDVSGVATNVSISGGTGLEFGDSFAHGYTLKGGTIDAHTSTGAVTTWLSHVGLNGGNAAQTFIAGSGTDFVAVKNFGGDVIDFSIGGTDTVEFTNAQGGGFSLVDNFIGGHNYNNVLGFTAAHDAVDVSVSGINSAVGALSYTDTGLPVAGGASTNALFYSSGTAIDGTLLHDNLIDIITPVNVLAGTTAQQGFDAAMGLGSIKVHGGSHTYLMSYYETTAQEAVLGTVTSSGTIDKGDTIHVIGLIHESQADYLAGFSSNVHFVA